MADRRAMHPNPATDTASEGQDPGLHLLPAALWPRLTGFPAALPLLIGREAETAVLRRLLAEPGHRIVTLTGPGGVGKTRLALAVAAELPGDLVDEAAFVPLAALSDSALVLPTVARVLAVRESPGRSLSDALATALANRRLLLVLDNLEHLPGATPDIAELLAVCPGLTVLATSRAPLRLSSEQRFLTPPLALPGSKPATPETLADFDSIALFLDRARRVRPDFVLHSGNSDAVVAVCRHLDGLPLAIELAAAWMHVLAPAALLARMELRLPLLTGGSADQPARLRTMRDAIAWSHDLLSDDEKRLFRRLGVFAGGFTLDAAEWVAADGSPGTEPVSPSPATTTLNLLASLVDKSLVQRRDHDEAEPRFSMLETVREFALEQLAAHGEMDRAMAAHATYFVDLAELAEPHLTGPNERAWYARFDAELDNLRVAFAWGMANDVEATLRLAAALWAYWAAKGPMSEARRWLTEALATGLVVEPRVRFRALTVAGALATFQGDTDVGVALSRDAAALAQDAGDPLGEARALFVVGGALWQQADNAWRAAWERSLALFEAAVTTTDHGFASYILAIRGASTLILGDREIAMIDMAASRNRLLLADSDLIRLLSLVFWGEALLAHGEPTEARESLLEALALGAQLGEAWPLGHSLRVLAGVDAADGDAVTAARRFGAADVVMARAGLVQPEEVGHRLSLAESRIEAAMGREAFLIAWQEGRDDPAAIIAAASAGAPAPVASPQSTRQRSDALLTSRERDVLHLLIAGRSDKQIAETLFISRKTASNHVASILRKLGVDTRAAAAARAVRDGLI